MTANGDAAGVDSGRRPLRRATTILGKKWHPVLIQTLLADGPLGFNDIKVRVDGISDKVLSESLEDLEQSGVVVRDVVEEKPVRVRYSLTAAGRDLEPVIEDLRRWGRVYLAETP
jgi:DNA-binding HxlR family transcriptional regulator